MLIDWFIDQNAVYRSLFTWDGTFHLLLGQIHVASYRWNETNTQQIQSLTHGFSCCPTEESLKLLSRTLHVSDWLSERVPPWPFYVALIKTLHYPFDHLNNIEPYNRLPIRGGSEFQAEHFYLLQRNLEEYRTLE